jgi:hypothetical protein
MVYICKLLMNYVLGKRIFNILKDYLVKIYMYIRRSTTRKYQHAEPEYEVCCRVSEANESQTSYSVEQADIFQ